MSTSKPTPLQTARLVIAIVVPSVLVLFGLLWLLAERQVFPSYRARLYHEPISSIETIRVSPGNNFPLVDHEVVIADAATIQEIMKAIRSAQAYFPNHPTTRWSCVLTISSSSGMSYVDVCEAFGQGTILHCTTSSGLIYDTLQSSTMGHILEQATKQNK